MSITVRKYKSSVSAAVWTCSVGECSHRAEDRLFCSSFDIFWDHSTCKFRAIFVIKLLPITMPSLTHMFHTGWRSFTYILYIIRIFVPNNRSLDIKRSYQHSPPPHQPGNESNHGMHVSMQACLCRLPGKSDWVSALPWTGGAVFPGQLQKQIDGRFIYSKLDRQLLRTITDLTVNPWMRSWQRFLTEKNSNNLHDYRQTTWIEDNRWTMINAVKTRSYFMHNIWVVDSYTEDNKQLVCSLFQHNAYERL